MSQNSRVPEVFVEEQCSPSFQRTLGVKFHDEVSKATHSFLSAHELVEDHVFESSCGSEDNAFTSEYLDNSKRVIKPSASLADLLNFSSGSSLGSGSTSSLSNNGSISGDKIPELTLEEIAEVKSSDGENQDFHLHDVTPRAKRISHGSLFVVEKHDKVDLATFHSNPTLSRSMSLKCARRPDAEETRTPLKDGKLNARVLGKELISRLEFVLTKAGDVRGGADAIARWLVDEGLIKQYEANRRSFEVEQMYTLCRHVEPNLWDGRRKDVIDNAEFEKTVESMKQTHKVEVDCLSSAKDKLAMKVEVLKNELDRLRSLRSSDVVKNKKKGSKLVEVEEGGIFEKNVSKLPESVPPPPPLPHASQTPPSLLSMVSAPPPPPFPGGPR